MANKSLADGANGTSMADIAATLVNASSEAAYAAEVMADEEEVTDQDVVDMLAEDPTSGDTDEASGEEESDDQATEEEEDLDAADVDDNDDPDYLDIRDDDVISVMVDGEEQEVSIADLKRAHSGEGAIEKRLQDVTEERKAVHAERTQLLEKLANEEAVVTEALSSLNDSVFAAVIPAPSDALRRSNPEQYLRHKEAYEADQKRVGDARKAVETRLADVSAERTKRLNEYSQQAGQIILKEIPELADPKKSPAMLQNLAKTARLYGYTDHEIQTALDPRMFMLMRDAARFRDMTGRTKETDLTNLEGQKTKKIRRLRTGNTQAKTRARQSDQKRTAALNKARQTGKPSDIAATLLVPKG